MHHTTMRPIVIALALALAGSAAAAPTVQQAGSRIVVDPGLDAPAYQVRLTGPNDLVIEMTRLDDEVIEFAPKAGSVWADGDYRYEIWPIVGVAKRGEHDAPRSTRPMTSTGGSFTVENAQVYAANPAAPASERDGQAKDQVVADDQIVQGSLCVGFDCVDGESFGTDTIRLKENNTRIKFDDTSTSAGYAANDWQLTANEQPSGGQNKFSIEDVTGSKVPFTILAGAPTNALYVDADGDVGLGTATPSLDVHLVTGNTPALRLEQNSSGGFTAQTWDVAGNEANFFVRDLTAGSKLPFRIRPGAPTSSIDIAASGNVGVGTASPAAKLDVTGNGGVLNLTGTDHSYVQFYPDGAATRKAYFGFSAAASDNVVLANEVAGAHVALVPGTGGSVIAGSTVASSIGSGADRLAVAGSIGTSSSQFNANPSVTFQMVHRGTGGWEFLTDSASKTPVKFDRLAPTNQLVVNATGVGVGTASPTEKLHVAGNIYGSGNITITGTLSQGSDRNSKENFAPVDSGDVLDKLASLDVTRWNYKADGGGVQHIGPMAQDFYALFGLGEAETKIAPLDTSGVTIVAVQELARRLQQRDAEVAALHERLDRRDDEVAAMREQLDRLNAHVAALVDAQRATATVVGADVPVATPTTTGM